MYLATFQKELEQADWYTDHWLEDMLAQVGRSFETACNRWRSLYLSALKQQETQNAIVLDANRSPRDRDQAKRLRAEAEEQLKLLTEVENVTQSDFYSYRYFASEGFLPGYNFPRLPLSAYIPARSKKQREEFLSRPRFLAITEFGPRAIVYHEGSRYEINRVILPVEERAEEDLVARQAKLCPHCGYLHPLSAEAAYDQCERCGQALDAPLRHLFRLQNVSTRRRERINSDEEERMRMGYDLLTGVRFAEYGGELSYRTARVVAADGTDLAQIAYGHAATLWRINLGWTRRENKAQYGFLLDIERGYWARNRVEGNGADDPLSPRVSRVIPYVEDRRNCLILTPETPLDVNVMASLQAALKSALQVVFQLEDNELAVEPLPSRDNRRHLLFYEASEGGAGVLRRLLDDPQALGRVGSVALRLCHFNPLTGEDEGRAPGAKEDCEAACYDCLRSYSNQWDHERLDRKAIHALLRDYQAARVLASPTAGTRVEHLDGLLEQADSELERRWLRHLNTQGHRLPTHAQQRIAACATRPDFLYLGDGSQAAIYIDGPPHDFADRQARDQLQVECMEDQGYLVIRFHHQDDWDAILARYPSLFGRAT